MKPKIDTQFAITVMKVFIVGTAIYIYCLFKGDSKDPRNEITICQLCNDDLREEFEEEEYNCDDWDET